LEPSGFRDVSTPVIGPQSNPWMVPLWARYHTFGPYFDQLTAKKTPLLSRACGQGRVRDNGVSLGFSIGKPLKNSTYELRLSDLVAIYLPNGGNYSMRRSRRPVSVNSRNVLARPHRFMSRIISPICSGFAPLALSRRRSVSSVRTVTHWLIRVLQSAARQWTLQPSLRISSQGCACFDLDGRELGRLAPTWVEKAYGGGMGRV
jgi:hypothetical protein